MIRTRFAPSPTGAIHIGSLRTALYSYALAKHSRGDFILRIEDTDKKREVPDSKEKIAEILKIFGLIWDEYYVQSERVATGVYQKAAEKLVEARYAYNDQGAIRLKVPRDKKIGFHDFVLRKDITWDTNTLSELILLKSDGFPTYHLAVVVDDLDMKVTHVLRGHDWLPSTPIHLLVYQGLGEKHPEIGHLTDILDPEGGKLSKRKGSTSVEGLLNEGYLPEALLNFIMLLGWAPKNNQEIFSLSEFVRVFDFSGFQKANPVFNKEKLDWFNGEYIRKTQNSKLKTQIYKFFGGKYPEDQIEKILPLVHDRIKTLKEFESLTGFFFERRVFDRKLFGKNYKNHLIDAIHSIEVLKKWDLVNLNVSLMKTVKEKGYKVGDFFMDLRVAITGSRFTPPINDSIIILGKRETLKRLRTIVK